ncbi:hypothetical protein [Bacillus sp. UNCCL13]|uniref:hypothetical protein n=1 Tax=Bacillus sp. UNCCL13 TaxID=1502772 RepID=UPI000B865710|nr:hypothetical protein [Bacillus sp. UNCCL13]
MSCGSSGTGETPQAHCAEEAHRPPKMNLFMKKPVLGLFHNSSAESEQSGVEINYYILFDKWQ